MKALARAFIFFCKTLPERDKTAMEFGKFNYQCNFVT
jgi:hypothetical protein